MNSIYYTPTETSWGTFMVASTNKGVCQIHYLKNDDEKFFKWLEKKLGNRGLIDSKRNKDAVRELIEYLDGKRKRFEAPLDLIGTPFQVRVWEELRKIPYGETASYSEIAQAVGIPKGARAIGMANNANPILLMVPCHRVIGKNGSLVGFESGLDFKEKLLKLEQLNKTSR